MVLQNGTHCGMSNSSDSTAGLQGDTIDCSIKMEDCKISERYMYVLTVLYVQRVLNLLVYLHTITYYIT